MKKLLWTSAMALTAAACMTACDDSSSGASNSIPEFKTEAALPDTCEMEVAKAGDTYFACFENKWIEVTDSATVEQLKEGLDEDEIKEKLEELEDLLKPVTPAKPKSSSSKKTDEDVESSDSEEPESSSSEECTGRRCKTGNSSSSKKNSGGSGSGDSGSGSGEGGSGEGGESSPSSAESSSPSSAETSSPSSAESSSPSSAETSSPSSASSSSLKRHVNFSVLDNFVEWDEDGITATFAVTTSGATLATKIQDAGFENTFVTSSSMTKDNELLKTLGSDWRVESNNLLSMMNVQTAKDSSIYVIIVTYPKKGEPVYTDVIPMGKCGTKAYSKRTQFCDTRGTGTIYKMVTIGTQTWMAENLNYPTSSGSSCHSDIPGNCDTYGRLYTWDAAKEACPSGWHLPSNSEFSTLASAFEKPTSLHMKADSDLWTDGKGDDTHGFSALPGGIYSPRDEKYNYLNKLAFFWSSNLSGSDAYYFIVYYNTDDAYFTTNPTTYRVSVRCIKDAE